MSGEGVKPRSADYALDREEQGEDFLIPIPFPISTKPTQKDGSGVDDDNIAQYFVRFE